MTFRDLPLPNLSLTLFLSFTILKVTSYTIITSTIQQRIQELMSRLWWRAVLNSGCTSLPGEVSRQDSARTHGQTTHSQPESGTAPTLHWMWGRFAYYCSPRTPRVMIVYAASVLVLAAWAAGSSGHRGATPRLCAHHHHHYSVLPLLRVLIICRSRLGWILRQCNVSQFDNNQYVTLSEWDLLNTVGVLGFLGQKLDPVLDLCHPGIDAMAGTLASIAHHTNLG